jgi:hypothetical protein
MRRLHPGEGMPTATRVATDADADLYLQPPLVLLGVDAVDEEPTRRCFGLSQSPTRAPVLRGALLRGSLRQDASELNQFGVNRLGTAHDVDQGCP